MIKVERTQKNKLRTYRKFKRNYKREEYLSAVKNIKHRISMTKFRISDHCLEIEKGRYTRPYTKPEDRVCIKLCNNAVEDEAHFLFICPRYSNEREELFLTINNKTNHQLILLTTAPSFYTL